MKIVTMPALPAAPASEPKLDAQSRQQDTANAESNKEKGDLQDATATNAAPDHLTSPGVRNILCKSSLSFLLSSIALWCRKMQQSNTLFHVSILVMVFGDGRVVGYNLDQAKELSSAVEFLWEKYPAVIGTCLLFSSTSSCAQGQPKHPRSAKTSALSCHVCVWN